MGTALIPYDDQTLLMQLAKEQGCDVEEYKRKVLDIITCVRLLSACQPQWPSILSFLCENN